MKNALLVVLLLLAGALFVERAFFHGREVNIDVTRTDQRAYLNYALDLRDTDFQYAGPRNRMPLYPGFLAVFFPKGESPEAVFDRAKILNTALAFAVLAGVGIVFLRTFPRHLALNGLFFSAFAVFVFKAAYAQAEVMYYGLTFAVFVCFWQLFRSPSLFLAAVSGVLLGLAHLTKASVLPGLLVFAVFYPLDALWRRTRQRAEKPWRRLGVTVLVVAGFFAVTASYLLKSKEIYGRYFYNVNSTFYIWCDSWEDAEARTKAAGDRKGWPDLPDEELPSLKNYLRTHSAADIAGRIFSGLSRVFKSTYAFGYTGLCLAWMVFCAYVAWRRRAFLYQAFRERPFPALALAAYFLGYLVLIAWYSQIIHGNRFILGLFLPFLFSVTAFAAACARGLVFRTPGGRQWDVLKAFNTVFSIWLAVEIAITCVARIPHTYGGS